MLRITEIKLPVKEEEKNLEDKIRKILHLKSSDFFTYKIKKKSIDARDKNDLQWVYTVYVQLEQEGALLKRKKLFHVDTCKEIKYQIPKKGMKQLVHRPVIIGSGPAGLFCGLLLAKEGYCPLILEQGKAVEERLKDVEEFWRTGKLNTDSNVQFGEGGAGTFSDGKLNTLVKDNFGRNGAVLDWFVKMGAPEEIRYVNKPHIGTDVLIQVLKNIRKEICSFGGEFSFESKAAGLDISNGKLEKIILKDGRELLVSCGVLAIGHSARDTFSLLLKKEVNMEAKSFAVGLRVEHPQEMMNESQYGMKYPGELGAASYKLAVNLPGQRGVYSFCMCPGGFVVNASSEEGRLAVNGMSYSRRDGKNANSAIIVTVGPMDFPIKEPLGGMEFQRQMEEKAFLLGEGKIPQQLFGDFELGRRSEGYGRFVSETKGESSFANLRELFNQELGSCICEGMHLFARKIKGFDRADAILSGVESRTSSPVRINRNEKLQSNIAGLYPCGEGAGYAGGIMSAAMDGLKVAEAIVSEFAPMKG